jgi:hypothetical protein
VYPGDSTFFVDAAGIRHPAIVASVNEDGTVELAVLNINKGRIPVSASPLPGHAWDPTLPASNDGDVTDEPAQNTEGLGAGNEGDSQPQEAPGPDQADPPFNG